MLRQALLLPFPSHRHPLPSARTLSKDLQKKKKKKRCFLGFVFLEGKTVSLATSGRAKRRKLVCQGLSFFLFPLSSLISLEEKLSWFFPSVEGKDRC